MAPKPYVEEIAYPDGTKIRITATAQAALLRLTPKNHDDASILLDQQELLRLQELIRKALRVVLPSKPYIV